MYHGKDLKKQLQPNTYILSWTKVVNCKKHGQDKGTCVRAVNSGKVT